MTKSIVQIENTTAEGFTNEILDGIKVVLENFASSTKSNDDNRLLSRTETAEMLGISLTTLWDYTRKDIIPAFRIGNKIRYKKSDVMEALQKHNKFSSKTHQ
ncbi:helix-turn-helix domain-containing protein [Flavobacterium sp. J49]|uniref:helix-turn-helix domain-containing protein n=1 Tax=Flavobacterium sp. J49 TaxID=2718534 RepID=UPI001592EF3D|nr:helix-turn-helix domain-containing protein [Flavobacterium sp. J49]MBF6641805.1 helix-turn-helix domain-containing protein [Flavobacterium sp. J49]NIC03052.1 helix-turn-helix domain-containing protein [Flavobacterium sp. J49]